MSTEGLDPKESKTDDKLTQKDWLEYLNRYNARYYAHQQASGFTIWALVGVLAFLGLEILKSLNHITNDFFMFSVFFTNLLNLYSAVLCTSSVSDSNTDNNYLESSFLKKWTDLFLPLYTIVVAITLVLSLWQSEFVRVQGFMPYGYFLQAGIYAIYLFSTLFRYVKHKFMNNKPGPKLAFISTGYEYRVLDAVGLALFLTCTGLSITGFTWEMVIEHNETLIRSIELFVFFLVIRILIDIIPTDKKIEDLEVLEYQILLYDLETEQIKKRFNEVWFNKSVVNWVNEKDLESKQLLNRAMDIENQLIELLENPNATPEELSQLHNTFNAVLNNLSERCRQYYEEVRKLSSRINLGHENHRIMMFLSELDKQILSIKKAFDHYSNQIQQNLIERNTRIRNELTEAAATSEPSNE